jgi:hypothetical protein
VLDSTLGAAASSASDTTTITIELLVMWLRPESLEGER